MGDYLNLQRNVLNTPHPVYGALPAGFGVGDLPSSNQVGLPVFNVANGNATSEPINIGANAIELSAKFSDLHTSCDIQVYKTTNGTLDAGDASLVTTFTGVSTLNCDNLYAGFAELNQTLGGSSLIFNLINYSGTGTLTLFCRRTG